MNTSINFASLLTFTGAGCAKRNASFAEIAKVAQLETASRGALVATIKDTLGKAPTDAEISAVRLQVQIGRIAGKITRAHLANPAQVKAYDADPLQFALDLATRYAAPKVAGKKARPLGTKLGYRTDTQHKLVRASDEAWSKLAAEIGIGGAKTQADADKAKRAARTVDTKKETQAAEFGKETQLVASTPVTADDYVQHMQTQLSALLAFDNKHAKVRPLTHSAFADALAALRQVGNTAANEFQLKRDADAPVVEEKPARAPRKARKPKAPALAIAA